MKKYLLATFSLIALLGAGCSKPADTYPVTPTPITTPPSAEAASSTTAEVKSYALDEVAKHADATDCWMAVGGKVYNVSGFVDAHPGGPAILKGCGKDATDLFNSVPKHNGVRAQDELKSLYIGDLK